MMQDAYCGLLRRYHEELSKPLDEAMAFLADIKLQVSKNTDNDEEDDDYGTDLLSCNALTRTLV